MKKLYPNFGQEIQQHRCPGETCPPAILSHIGNERGLKEEDSKEGAIGGTASPHGTQSPATPAPAAVPCDTGIILLLGVRSFSVPG